MPEHKPRCNTKRQHLDRVLASHQQTVWPDSLAEMEIDSFVHGRYQAISDLRTVLQHTPHDLKPFLDRRPAEVQRFRIVRYRAGYLWQLAALHRYLVIFHKVA